MATLIHITLLRDIEVKWPPRCAVCGNDEPNGFLELRAESVTVWSWVWLWRRATGKKIYRAKAPACKACADAVENDHEINVMLGLFAAAVGIAIVYWLAGDLWNDWTWRLWGFVGVLLGVSPVVAWQVLRPQAVEVMRDGDGVTFSFTDADYARAFAELNGVALLNG